LKRARLGLADRRIPKIDWKSDGPEVARGQCPYFIHAADTFESQKAGRLLTLPKAGPFPCPFYAAWQTLRETSREFAAESAVSALEIHQECIADKLHQDQYQAGARPKLYQIAVTSPPATAANPSHVGRSHGSSNLNSED
jgi:hypothetical protein